jgi:cytochrome c oxidase subunit IV
MDNQSHTTASEITIHHAPSESTRRIWKTTIILSVLTMFELSLGLLMYATDFPHWADMFIKGVIVILTLAKAFYIISIFMHLGDEIRNMIMTMAMPILLFVWFITAFLWDGSSFRELRNRYDRYYQERTLEQNEVKPADTTTHPLQ